MKIVFMGTPDFAVPSLERLIKHHDVVCVVTKMDKERGRGRKVQYSPIKEVAMENNIPVYQPKKIKDVESVEYLKQFDADLFIVIAYGQILSKELLDMPKKGCINIHGSILPKYRGAAPIHWAIINGETETGATVMYMDEGMDTGDIIKVAKMPITPTNTLGEVYEEMRHLGANALIEVLVDIEKGIINRTPQNDDEATIAPLIKKELGKIDFSNTTANIINLTRGLNPMPCTFFSYKDIVFKVHSASDATKKIFDNHKNGTIVAYDKNNGLVIKTGDGFISIDKIQKQGSKAMDIKNFINGNGDMFTINDIITNE